MHLVYLDAKTAQKNKITIGRDTNTFTLAKQTFGPMKGASIQLGDSSGIPHLAEGPETGLSILALNPKARVYITCSLSNIANVGIHGTPDKVIFCADNDMVGDKVEQTKKNLLTAVEKLTENYWAPVYVILPPIIEEQKTHFNDILRYNNIIKARCILEQATKSSVKFETHDFKQQNNGLNHIFNTQENKTTAHKKLNTLMHISKLFNIERQL